MPVSGAAMNSALNALKQYSRQVDQAASRIAEVDVFPVPNAQAPERTSPTPTQAVASADLGGAMVDMMVAQRAFAAQIRVLKSSDDMLRNTVDLGSIK